RSGLARDRGRPARPRAGGGPRGARGAGARGPARGRAALLAQRTGRGSRDRGRDHGGAAAGGIFPKAAALLNVSGSPRARWLPPVAGLAFFAVFVAPVLQPGVQLFYRDTGRLYYPVKLYIAQTLKQGRLPLWDTMPDAGVSLLGQLTPGLLHPLTLLYLALPFDLAFKLNHLLALLLGGAGAYRLSRRL